MTAAFPKPSARKAAISRVRDNTTAYMVLTALNTAAAAMSNAMKTPAVVIGWSANGTGLRNTRFAPDVDLETRIAGEGRSAAHPGLRRLERRN